MIVTKAVREDAREVSEHPNLGFPSNRLAFMHTKKQAINGLSDGMIKIREKTVNKAGTLQCDRNRL